MCRVRVLPGVMAKSTAHLRRILPGLASALWVIVTLCAAKILMVWPKQPPSKWVMVVVPPWPTKERPLIVGQVRQKPSLAGAENL